jgi:hypothetical protein
MNDFSDEVKERLLAKASAREINRSKGKEAENMVLALIHDVKAQGRREAAKAFCQSWCGEDGDECEDICNNRKTIIGTASDEAPKAKEHSEYFGGESALSVACEIFNKLHLENESIVYWIKIEIENWYKEKAKNERSQGRLEAAEAFLKVFDEQFRNKNINRDGMYRAILGTASDEKTDKGEPKS